MGGKIVSSAMRLLRRIKTTAATQRGAAAQIIAHSLTQPEIIQFLLLGFSHEVCTGGWACLRATLIHAGQSCRFRLWAACSYTLRLVNRPSATCDRRERPRVVRLTVDTQRGIASVRAEARR